MAHCSLKEDLLGVESVVRLRSRYECLIPGLPCMKAEVAELLAMKGACSASARPNSPAEAADCVLDTVEWLESEDLPEAVFETASRIESASDESDT